MRFENQTVLLTGAAGGIGRALVAALLARGVRRIHAADVVAAPEPSDRRVTPHRLDITDHVAVERCAADCADVTLLINNAGANMRSTFTRASSLDAARREMEVNYFGTLAMCRAFAPVLARNGGGTLVNVASILAKITNPPLGSYSASKAALLRLTEGVRAELAAQGTHVLAVMPWAVDTPMSGPFAGPKSTPEETAEVIVGALAAGAEEAYVHEMAHTINARLATDPKGLEREFAAFLPKVAG